MDLARPLSLVSPGVHGSVLTVLARSDQPLTGRGIARLVNPPASASGVQKVLDELVAGGLVHRTMAGRALLHSLNRAHLSAAAVVELVDVKQRLIRRLQELAGGWKVQACGVWLFGSVATGRSDRESDLDVLAVRANDVSEDDPTWRDQLAMLASQVLAWTGNGCELIELAESELKQWVERDEPLLRDIRRDALVLSGKSPRNLGVGRLTRADGGSQ